MPKKMMIWACPVCGKELKIGPAFMNFQPYCSDLKCSYNHQVWTAEAEATKSEKETGEK